MPTLVPVEFNFELNCFILGDDPSRTFSVKILETDTVSKQHSPAMEVWEVGGAESLTIWNLKVNIDPEKEKLDLPHDAENLKPLTRLSKVFTVRQEDEHLHLFVQHIVVQPPPAADYPSIHLNCLVLDDDPSHIFPVKILQTDTVSNLKKVIKEENKHEFDGVDAKHLKLWKDETFDPAEPIRVTLLSVVYHIRSILDIDPEKKEKLDLPDDAKELKPLTQLSQVFTVGPEDGHRDLHILVQYPTSRRN
ncbi:uncharacterized protein HD556DRAFT_1303909 [Suillus plorans]|uniref:Crinkler effector protein N-terminal domain-containing protein n=1 Tax=Suillus plorans TaxID=116603 RepID=A0A9P7J5L2_9AGAM|nr:uncharacterized protein HD556DRAFT_1303909 [Suillus plorans]KAG1803933.1 hypothetical protein HD556DRAFT_1303909 [Suillus plorans]